MLYLIRFAEGGRESQPQRRKLRHDIEHTLRTALPGARISATVGRVFVDSEVDATDVIGETEGITSFSPCHRCDLTELDAAVVERAAELLPGGGSFQVRVKRIGTHEFGSRELVRRLSESIRRRLPSAVVELEHPDAVIGVEVRQHDCYVFDTVLPGIGWRAREPMSPSPDRFVVDQMLGPLTRWLRLLGFDAIYFRDVADSVLLRVARKQGRMVLTRDRELAAQQSAPVLLLANEDLDAQLREVVERLDLEISRSRMFTRCAICNVVLEPVDKQAVRDDVPAEALRVFDEFTRCPQCKRIYWKGGHYERILHSLEGLIDA